MINNLSPQSSLRSPRASHPSPRPRTTAGHLAWLARHLTPRDRWLAHMLHEHHVLTSNQIIDLAFSGRRTANMRLHNLYQWGVVNRFQPHREFGSFPMHYVLDITGAAVLAYEAGISPSELRFTRENAASRAYSLQLAHDVACNSLFASLVRHARQPNSDGRLTAWWSATRCRRLWGDIVTPDGYGRWHQDGQDVEWFLEFDFGTEQRSRLAAKIHRYAQLAASTGIATPVLFWFPTAKRELSVRPFLAEAHTEVPAPDQVPVATTSSPTADDPLDMPTARWQRVGPSPVPDRVRLTELLALWPDLAAPTPLDDPEPTGPHLAAPSPMPPPLPEYRKRSAA
jgi:hypothetical protein